MKIVTFLPGPLASMPFPPTSQNRAQPYAEIPQHHAAPHIQQTQPTLAVADCLVSLVFGDRERCVSTENPHYQEQPPVWMRLESLGQERHQDSDEKCARYIDDERAQRKPAAVFRHDPGARHIAGQAAEAGARQHYQVFVQSYESPFVSY